MEDLTPTFNKDFVSPKKHNFSDEIDKLKGSPINNNLESEKRKNKNEQHHHHHHHHHHNKKRYHSEKFNLRDYGVISEKQDIKSISKSSKNINVFYNFMKKKKFKLRNDFDKKHVEKFLLSKEEAFEKPFLSIDNKEIHISSNFTLKNE